MLLPTGVRANYFTLPVNGSTPISGYFDHDNPGSEENDYFLRYDGVVWDDGSASPSGCNFNPSLGEVNCYDGHNGTDFDGNYGDDIFATRAGTVEDIWWNNFNGWAMHIYHDDIGLSTLYAHIATTTIATTSDSVMRGQHIAEMDSTGISSGAHLHFGVTDGYATSTSNRIDPFGWSGTTTDPWSSNQGYLWTTNPPSLYEAVSGTISSDTTWEENSHKVISGSLTIGSGATLTIEPGVVVKFLFDSSTLNVNSNGALNAQGTPSSPIYFTSYKDDAAWGDTNNDAASASPASGDWDKIVINSGASTTLSYVTVRYGGNVLASNPANIFVNGGTLTIATSTVSYGGTYGIRQTSGTTTATSLTLDDVTTGLYFFSGGDVLIASSTISTNNMGIEASGSGSLTVTDSTFTGQSTPASISLSGGLTFTHSGNTASSNIYNAFLLGGTVGTDQTWTADTMPYLINANTTVSEGKTLTLEPGVVVKFINDGVALMVSGTLDAQGASSSPIYFTSLHDDEAGGDTNGTTTAPTAGDWYHIQVNSGGIANLSYTTVRYGGHFYFSGDNSNIYNNGGMLTLATSTVSYGGTSGVRQTNGTTTASGTEFMNNAYGLYITGGTTGDIINNSFHNNSSNGLNNSTGATTTAEYNYWGASDGPSGVGPGSGDQVSTYVDYDPWLTTWP